MNSSSNSSSQKNNWPIRPVWLLFLIVGAMALVLLVKAYSVSDELEKYAAREFEVKLGIRSANQVRFHLYTVGLTAQSFMECSDLKITNQKLDSMFQSVESALAQLGNGFPREPTPEARRLLNQVYQRLEELSSIDEKVRSAKHDKLALRDIVSKSAKIQELSVAAENELVKLIAEKAAELSSSKYDSSLYYSILLVLGICLFVVLINQVYKKEKALQDLSTLNQELAQEKMRSFQMEKMSILGEMAAGVAHEVNNPLSIMTGYIGVLRRLKIPNEQAEVMNESLNRLESMVARISKIVRGLLQFARDGQQDKMTISGVNEIVEDTLILCQSRLDSKNVALKFERPTVNLRLKCRPTQISQVLLNLINNSFDEVCEMKPAWIRISVERVDSKIEISVVDSGKGVPKDIQEKMFQPFFTSKEVGKGVGLGLSISKGIIEDHGGTLSLDAASVHTKFVISLPEYSGPEVIT